MATCVTFLLFVRPFLKRMQGIANVAIKPVEIPAGFDWRRAKNRREYVRARLSTDSGGAVSARLYPKQGSDILTSMAWADGLVEIRENETIRSGQMIRFISFAEFLA